MTEHLVCNVCETPGTLADSREQRSVRCNVRAFRDEYFTMWRCNACESLHCKEGVDLAHYYRKYFVHSCKIDIFQRCLFRNRIKQLRRAGWNEKKSILDYGCAAGIFVQYLRGMGIAADGYDPFSSEWADESQLKPPYDALVTYDVIEHDEDPRAMMLRLSKLVRPGGLLLFATPDGAKMKLSPEQDWLPYTHVPYHRHILSERALRQLGEAAGMRVKLVEHIDLLDSVWPSINFRFVCSYIRACGGCLDAINDPPQLAKILTSPRLLFDALYGSLFSHGVNMTVAFTTPEAAS